MDETFTPAEALAAALNVSGSQSAFARLCGVSQPSVWKWLQTGKSLPAEHVLKVEQGTGVSRHLLRPDIYPPSDVPTSSPAGDNPSVATGAPTADCDRGAFLQPGGEA